MDFKVAELAVLLARVPPSNKGCTIDTCPVELSVYGYRPNKPLNLVFLALFAISLIIHIVQGIKHRAWSFLTALGIGTFLSAIGYAGRFIMHKDPFARVPLAINLVCLTVAPAFMAAGLYLTLKHLVIILGPQHSRFSPKWYTRIFIACDLLSIIIQTAGASISSKPSLADIANGLMEAGIIFQVITLLIFGGLAVEFYFRCRKDNSSKSRSDIRTPDSTSSLRQDDTSEKPLLDRRLKLSLIAVVIAYFAILIRCIYRIAEMVGGWRNPIMQDQVLFVVLDGIMCIIACLVLNAFHPGAIFEKSKQVMLNGGIDDGGVVADTGAVDMEMAPIKMGEQGAK